MKCVFWLFFFLSFWKTSICFRIQCSPRTKVKSGAHFSYSKERMSAMHIDFFLPISSTLGSSTGRSIHCKIYWRCNEEMIRDDHKTDAASGLTGSSRSHSAWNVLTSFTWPNFKSWAMRVKYCMKAQATPHRSWATRAVPQLLFFYILFLLEFLETHLKWLKEHWLLAASAVVEISAILRLLCCAISGRMEKSVD